MKIFGIVLVSAVVIGLAAIFLIPNGGHGPNPTLWKIENDARVTARNILDYSHQVEHYPSSLEKIRKNYGKREIRYFEDPESKREYEWLYHGAGMPLWENPHQKILIASPTKFRYDGDTPTEESESVRIVAFADGHSEVLEESEYQKQIHNQSELSIPFAPPSLTP